MLTEGERWARAELRRLIDSGFSPAACTRFVATSWRRSSEIRRARPGLARHAWRWMAVGGGLYVALIPAHAFRPRVALAWWGATAAMLDWHLGMFETEDGQPRDLGAADALTLARAWLVPLALERPAPAVCLVAAATDALDGPAARRAGPTRAGRDLEGLVDACFALAALRGARRRGWLGRAPAVAEAARVGAGVAYAVGVWFGRAQPPPDHLLHAARWTTALRAAGLITAGTGRRSAAGALLLGGSTLSLGLLGRAFVGGRGAAG